MYIYCMIVARSPLSACSRLNPVNRTFILFIERCHIYYNEVVLACNTLFQ